MRLADLLEAKFVTRNEIRLNCARISAGNACISASTTAFNVSAVQAIRGLYSKKVMARPA